MNILRAKTPLRVSFSGGGTDVEPYSVEHGGLVLSSCINMYAYASLEPRDDSEVLIHSLDYNTSVKYDVREELSLDGRLDLLKAIVDYMGLKRGANIFIHNDAPPGSGLGSSGAIGAMFTGLIAEYQCKSLSKYEMAEIAIHVEREILNVAGGKQDQFSTVYGGLNFIEFCAKETIVNQMKLERETLMELEYHLLLVYTKKTHYSGDLIETQIQLYKDKNKDNLEGLHELKRLTIEMKNELIRGRLNNFGELLHEAWINKIKMNPLTTTDYVNSLYKKARDAGAKGGKILGAGGGGYLLLYTPFEKKHIIAKAVKEMGAEIVNFSFDSDGLQIWNIKKDNLYVKKNSYIIGENNEFR